MPAEPVALAGVDAPDRFGWAQVQHSRSISRPSGRELAATLLDERVALRGGDDSVGAWVGLLAGRSVVLVAAGADRAGRATPAGYHLLRRAAGLAGHLGLPLVTLVDTAGADPLPDSENAGMAASIAGALTDVLGCPSPTVAVVHGEGGSGGALAAAVCDVVAVTAGGWFAALSPEGAGAALRRRPDDVRADGFADAIAPSEPTALRGWLASAIDALEAMDPVVRRQQRDHRWRGPLRPRRPDASS